MEERQVVRATLMRATLHLMTADDYLLLRPALQPALTRSMNSIAGKRLEGLDLDQLVAAARGYFEREPGVRPVRVEATMREKDEFGERIVPRGRPE